MTADSRAKKFRLAQSTGITQNPPVSASAIGRSSQLFAYDTSVSTAFLRNLYANHSTDFESFLCYPPGFEEHLQRVQPDARCCPRTPQPVQDLVCQCEGCIQGVACDRFIVKAELSSFQPNVPPWDAAAVGEKVLARKAKNSWKLGRPGDWGRNPRRPEIMQEDDRIVLMYEGQRKLVYTYYTIKFVFMGLPGSLRVFAMTPHGCPSRPSGTKHTIAEYIITELEKICVVWDSLLANSKQFLSMANREILNESGCIDQHLVRKLTKAADTWESLRDVQQQQLETWKFLRTPNNDNILWFTDARSRSRYAVNQDVEIPPSVLQEMRNVLDRLERIGIEISKELIERTDRLIERTHNLISIDEAYKSREQNASMKRLSWITFIFLPMLFVSSLYGMNIDLLKNNPSWVTVLYVAVPLFIISMASVVLLREGFFRWVWFLLNAPFTAPLGRTQLRRYRKRISDLESRGSPVADEGDEQDCDDPNSQCSPSTAHYATFFWAARHGYLNALRQAVSFGTVDVNYRDATGMTALQISAGLGHLGVVRYLLHAGADANAPPPPNGLTALGAAARGAHLAIVKLLLQKNTDIHWHGSVATSSPSVLRAAEQSGDRTIKDLLLNRHEYAPGLPDRYI